MSKTSTGTAQDAPSERPTLASLIKLAMEGRVADVRVTLPATVIAYDKERQCIDAQPLIDDRFSAEDETPLSEQIPPVLDVPVGFKAGGGFYETFPIAVGDTVMLHFCSSSISRWKATGLGGDPGDSRRHHVTDAIAYAGGRDFKHALPNIPDDAWMIFIPAGKQLRLGGPTTPKSVARAEDLIARIDALLVGIKAGFAAVPGSGTSIAATFQGIIQAWNAAKGSIASPKVKVE